MDPRRAYYQGKAWPIEKEDRKMVWATLIAIWLGLLFLLGLLTSWQPRHGTWRSLVAAGEQEAAAGRLWGARGHLIVAYHEAVKAQSVEGLLLVGDAFVQQGWVAHGEPSALKIYLHALAMAKDQGAVHELPQVAERLSRIGRVSLAEEAYRAAQGLTRQTEVLQRGSWSSTALESVPPEE